MMKAVSSSGRWIGLAILVAFFYISTPVVVHAQESNTDNTQEVELTSELITIAEEEVPLAIEKDDYGYAFWIAGVAVLGGIGLTAFNIMRKDI